MDNKITSLKEVKPGMVVEVRKQNGTIIPCLVVLDEYEDLVLAGQDIWCDLNSFNKANFICMGHSIAAIYDIRNNGNTTEVSIRDRDLLWSASNIDFSKLKVDDIVYVKLDGVNYKPRHFARYRNGLVYTWDGGKSSQTASNLNDVSGWAEMNVRLSE